MIIHVVQPGETINSIANYYGKPVDRLILENELETPDNLVVGQTIVVVYPKQIYTVLEGDSLIDIADSNGITLMQLLRNNPYLSDREFIYPGETLVISYDENIIMKISINGYAYPFININTLKKSLPFLTYLTIFHYSATAEGELNDINDMGIIQIAKEYGVAPIMIISTLTSTGTVDINVAHSILNDEEKQNKLIDNVLTKLKSKGYYALNIDSQFIPPEDRQLYFYFISKITNRLNKEGYKVDVTITPNVSEIETKILYEGIDHAGLSQAANGIMLLPYAWGHTTGLPIIPFETIRNFLDYVVTQIPPEKISIGITTIGYTCQLPYREGSSKANAISYTNAIQMAGQVGATIQYDETSQVAFFYFGENNENIVWFKDARSNDITVKLVSEYGFEGIGLWNIMVFLAQMALVINSQYEIEKIL